MKRSRVFAIVGTVLIVGAFAGMPKSASAHDGHGYGGGYGYGWGGYSSRYQPRWHDTSHWDYHPPTVVPHGDHFHVTPGHYDWHETGHWHGPRRYRGYWR